LSYSGRPLLHLPRQFGDVERRRSSGERLELFGHVEQVAAVPVRHGDQCLTRVVVERQRTSREVFGADDQRVERGLVQSFQQEDLASGQQGAVQLEAGVLGRRPDEHDRAVLHVREEAVLLRPVEPVDLVDEQQRSPADLPPVLGGLEHLAQVGDPGERRGQRLELQVGLLRQQPGDRGLPTAGRPPQDPRDQPLPGDHAPDRGVGRQQVVLTDHVPESPGSQPVGQRPLRVVVEQRQRRFGVLHQPALGSCLLDVRARYPVRV
jgi:hypothetical protein